MSARRAPPELDPLALWRAWVVGWCGFGRGVLALQIELLRRVSEAAGSAADPASLDSVGTTVNAEERRRRGWRPATSNADLGARPQHRATR